MNKVLQWMLDLAEEERNREYHRAWNLGQQILRGMWDAHYREERETSEWIDLGGEG